MQEKDLERWNVDELKDLKKEMQWMGIAKEASMALDDVEAHIFKAN